MFQLFAAATVLFMAYRLGAQSPWGRIGVGVKMGANLASNPESGRRIGYAKDVRYRAKRADSQQSELLSEAEARHCATLLVSPRSLGKASRHLQTFQEHPLEMTLSAEVYTRTLSSEN